jgi:hypothetical protein
VNIKDWPKSIEDRLMSRRLVKGKDMSRSAKVNVPWFLRQHYDVIKRLVADRSMPDTFEEWLEVATEYVEKMQARGVIVKTVVIDPEQFDAYCRACRASHFKATLAEFAVVMTRKQHESGKYQGGRSTARRGHETLRLGSLPKAAAGSNQEEGRQEREKGQLNEIIARVADLFDGDFTDDDRLVFLNHAIKARLLRCQELVIQATYNTKAEFASSPTLSMEIIKAAMDTLAAHTSMSKQTIASERVREGIKEFLLGSAQLYEALRRMARK